MIRNTALSRDAKIRTLSLRGVNLAASQAGTVYFFALPTWVSWAICAIRAHRNADLGMTYEIQNVTLGGDPDGGTFTLTLVNPVTGVSATTAAIDFDASSAEVQAALEALANVEVGEVSVGTRTGTGGNYTWPVTLKGRFAQANPATMTGDETGLTDGGSYVDETVTITAATPFDQTAETPTLHIGIGPMLASGVATDPDAIGILEIGPGLRGTYEEISAFAAAGSELESTLIDPNVPSPESMGCPIVPKGTGIYVTVAEDLESGHQSGTVDVEIDVAPRDEFFKDN